MSIFVENKFEMAIVRIKLVKSMIGCPKDQKRTLYALRLRKINQIVEHNDNSSIRGMIEKIKHLVVIYKSPQRLYIIGNGFDIGHKIPCKWSDFYNYLKVNRRDILETMETFYDLTYYKDKGLWCDFEKSLEKDIFYDSLSEIITENAPVFGSDDFREGDWYDAQIYIEDECKKLLMCIRSGYEEWIRSLEFSQIYRRYKLDRTAQYFTFNYTDVLERIYRVSPLNILHIHNKVGENLIFGHGKKTKDFNVKKALYGNENFFLSENKDGDIESSEVGHERFAEDAVCLFYDKMRKKTEEVIQNHLNFFGNLSEIDEVIVLGHSYNDIDLPYFKKIAKSVNNKAKWILYYYSDKDKECAKKVMRETRIAERLQNHRHCTELEIKDTQLKLF